MAMIALKRVMLCPYDGPLQAECWSRRPSPLVNNEHVHLVWLHSMLDTMTVEVTTRVIIYFLFFPGMMHECYQEHLRRI